MAIRTSEDDIRSIITVSDDDSLIVQMETANAIIDRVQACALAKGIVLTDTELRLMETWVAARYYLLRRPQLKSKSTGDASASWETLDYLDSIKPLDISGCLAAIMSGQRAGMTWLGKPKYQRDAETLEL